MNKSNIPLLILIVAIISLIVSVSVPELRNFFGLDTKIEQEESKIDFKDEKATNNKSESDLIFERDIIDIPDNNGHHMLSHMLTQKKGFNKTYPDNYHIPDNKSGISFFKKESIDYNIWIDKKYIGVLKKDSKGTIPYCNNNLSLYTEINPGSHLITIQSTKKHKAQNFRINIEGGYCKTYEIVYINRR